MKRILIADESAHEVRPFVTELAIRGIEVVQCRDADDCLNIVKRDRQFALLLLDVMLSVQPEAHLSAFSREETDNYLVTGLVLAQRIREIEPAIPIVFFTSTGSDSLRQRIESTMSAIGHATVLFKHQFKESWEFREIIETMLETGIEASKGTNFKTWLQKVVVLQPNFAGMGIDIKELLAPLFRKRKKGQR